MKNTFTRLMLICGVTCVTAFGFVSAGPYDTQLESSADTSMGNDRNLVQLAQNNPQLSTLVKALMAADLVSTLQGNGPFTVFAPTNDAFDKLPPGVLQNLLKPENKAKLVEVLSYHVIPEKVLSSDIKTMKAKTLNGKNLDVKVQGAEVKVNNANVTKTDLVGSNGVIHIIDAVLIP
jgi:uncharacterized surface protein with fasciclin (FAS1) repeats